MKTYFHYDNVIFSNSTHLYQPCIAYYKFDGSRKVESTIDLLFNKHSFDSLQDLLNFDDNNKTCIVLK